MNDLGHQLTEQELKKLENRIKKVYKEAHDELDKTVKEYFMRLMERDVEQKKLLEAGKITEQQYLQWRLAQIGRGERFEALRDEMARRYTDANEVAVAYVNDTTPGIYTLNRNYAAYTIDTATGGGISFPEANINGAWTLFDEQTIKRLVVEQPNLMPYYPKAKALKRGIDLAYGKKQITATVTSAILQGKSIKGIADDLQNRMETMNRASAIRTARTAVTGAQNGGRQATYEAAIKMGIKMRKRWLATLDNRTRHSHRVLDGEIIEVGKTYSNGCRYPGDPNGAPHEIYNCRCTETAVIDGIDTSDAQRRARDPKTGRSVLIKDTTYREWEAWQIQRNQKAWEIYQKKGANLSSDGKQFQEYKKILGSKIPNTLDGFQDLKYNEPEKWRMIKIDKSRRMELKHNPGLSLPGEKKVIPDQKFTGYLFNPENKRGIAKGVAFESRLEYNADNWKDLKNEISRNKSKYPVLQKEKDEHGTRYEQKMILYGKTGNPTNVVVAWILGEDGIVRMTSAYIKEV